MNVLLAHAGEATETGEMIEMMRQMMGRGGWGMMGGPWMTPLSGVMGSGWMWLGGVFWLVTWVLVIAILVALLRWLWKKGS